MTNKITETAKQYSPDTKQIPYLKKKTWNHEANIYKYKMSINFDINLLFYTKYYNTYYTYCSTYK